MVVDLEWLAATAAGLYGDRLDLDVDSLMAKLRPFLRDRIRHLLGLRGYAYDEVAAALAAQSTDLPDLAARVDALHRVRKDSGFLDVVLAAKRIANIIKDAEETTFAPDRLIEPAAIELHQAALDLRREIDAEEEDGDYEKRLRGIARLAGVLDQFFVEVLVMDKDRALRQNRIALLQLIHRDLSRTAQLTEMVVDRAEHRARSVDADPGGH